MSRSCYIAGPMRGIPEFNFPAFHAAAAHLRAEGWTVISPAEMDEEAGDHVFTFQQNREFVRRDVEALLILRPENRDAIFFLPGYERSKGATAELHLGRWLGLELVEYTTGKLL